MGLADIVRSGVALASSATGALQANVTHEAWISNDSYTKPTYAAAVTRAALVEEKLGNIRTAAGTVLQQRARVSFLGPIAANGAATRREPIDPRDRITLPDGTTGPILAVEGLVDPSTGKPFLYIVAMG